MIDPEIEKTTYLSIEKVNDPGKPNLSLFWRIAIVFMAVTGVWLLIGGLADTLFGPEYSRPAHIFQAVLTSLVVIPMIVLARRFLDRRSFAGLGLTRLRVGWRPLLIGMLCWFLPASMGIGVSVALGWTEITPQAPPGDIVLLGIGLMLLVFIYEALPEELIFRGYIYRNLASNLPRWLAVFGQALLFMLWGFANGGANSVERSLLFFMAALILGIFRVVTGSLWASIGFHLAFQTIAQLFGTIGNQFFISDPQVVSVFAFGIIPFATGITLLNLFYKNRPHWLELEPEPAGNDQENA